MYAMLNNVLKYIISQIKAVFDCTQCLCIGHAPYILRDKHDHKNVFVNGLATSQ